MKFPSPWLSVSLLLSLSVFGSSASGPLDHWTVRHSDSNPNAALYGITYGNGLFVAVGDFGVILTSRDGVSWTPQNSGATNRSLRNLIFCNGRFYALGIPTDTILLSSADGTAWSSIEFEVFGGPLRSVLWTNNLFVAVSSLSDTSQGGIHSSIDGVHWTTRFYSLNAGLDDVIFANGRFVAVGAGTFVTSTDGFTWTVATNLLAGWGSIAYGNNTFAAVGNYASFPGYVATSTNGLDWILREPGINWRPRGIAFGNGNFVVAAENGVIMSSDDAVNWAPGDSGIVTHLGHVFCARGRFFVLGTSNMILSSDHYGPPILSGHVVPGGSGFEVTIESESGANFTVQSSTNRVDWTDCSGVTNAVSITSFTDSAVASSPLRIYRSVTR